MRNDKTTSAQAADGLLKRESFVFYESWWNAIRLLPREVQGEVVTAIVEYGLTGQTTEPPKPIAASILELVKVQISVNNQRYLNSLHGGRPKRIFSLAEKGSGDGLPENNQKETESKPNNNQSATNPEPNVNVNENVNVNTLSHSVCRARARGEGSDRVFRFLLSDGSEYAVPERDVESFSQEFPTLDVRGSLRNMELYFEANPAKRRTPAQAAVGSMRAYIRRWLSEDARKETMRETAGSKRCVPETAGERIEAFKAEISADGSFRL